MKYRAEIDGLRALAVVPVILFHAGFELFSGGFVGVDVFFVISGYLITTILIEDIENKRFSLVNFYERRARRILPALFFVMFLCIPFAWMWMLPSQMKEFSQSLVAVSLFASNIFFWRESDYFASAAEEKPLLHTWSLAVEEQYYLLFPIFLLLAWRSGKSRVFWMIVIFTAISLGISEWGWRNKATANFYLAPGRAWELFFGSISAFIVQKRGVQANNAMSLIGLSAIVFAIFTYDKNTPFPSVYALVPVVGVVMLILFAAKETIAGKLLGAKLFVGIGLVSYSAYLWHQPLFAFARVQLFDTPGNWLMLFFSSLSFGLAVFSWRYVEKPFRGKDALLKSKTVLFGSALSGLIVFSLVGIYGHSRDGYSDRFTKVLSGDVSHLEFHQYIDERYLDCEPKKIADEALKWEGFLRCKQSSPGDADWVLLGDSHAEHLFLGLAESSPSKNIVFYIFGGKPYIDNVQFETIFESLLDTNKSKTILLTMHYVDHLRSHNDLVEGFSNVILELQEVGHEVVLVGDIPRYDVHPQECVFGKNAARSKHYCSMGKEEAVAQEMIYNEALVNISKKFSVDFYSISDPLCDEDRCSMVHGDVILYRDKNHLNIPGSILIGQYLSRIMSKKYSL